MLQDPLVALNMSTTSYGDALHAGTPPAKNAIGIYKISRDRSMRETSHKVNVKESTWVHR